MNTFVVVETLYGTEVGFFLSDMAYIEFTDKVKPPGLMDGVVAIVNIKGTPNVICLKERGLKQFQLAAEDLAGYPRKESA